MTRVDTWMPLYIGDYLSDTMHLTCEQSGAYLHLIMHYWRAGSLPASDVALAQIARLPLKAWKAHREIIEPFFRVDAGRWTHKRIDAERERSAKVKERYSERGQKAAAKRWSKDASSNATSIPEGCNGHGNSQSHSSNELIESSNEDLSAEPTEKPLTIDEIVEAWNERMVPQGFSAVRRLTTERRRKIGARLRENTLDDWQRALGAIERSSFLRGENERGWRADFDFLLQPKSFTKLIEGAYDH